MGFEALVDEWQKCNQKLRSNLNTIAKINAKAKTEAIPYGIENAKLAGEIKTLEKSLLGYLIDNGLSEEETSSYKAVLNFKLEMKPRNKE